MDKYCTYTVVIAVQHVQKYITHMNWWVLNVINRANVKQLLRQTVVGRGVKTSQCFMNTVEELWSLMAVGRNDLQWHPLLHRGRITLLLNALFISANMPWRGWETLSMTLIKSDTILL